MLADDGFEGKHGIRVFNLESEHDSRQMMARKQEKVTK